MFVDRLLLLTLLLSLVCCTVRKEEGDPSPEPASPERKEAALPEQAPKPAQDPWEGLFDPAALTSPPGAPSPREATSIPAFPTPSDSAEGAPASAEASTPTTLPSPGAVIRLIESPEKKTP